VGHKSFVRKGGSDEPGGRSSFKGQTRPNNKAHESNTKVDALLYCKGKTVSELRFMGHTLSDKRQATSDKRQATSDKRQATSDKRQAPRKRLATPS